MNEPTTQTASLVELLAVAGTAGHDIGNKDAGVGGALYPLLLLSSLFLFPQAWGAEGWRKEEMARAYNDHDYPQLVDQAQCELIAYFPKIRLLNLNTLSTAAGRQPPSPIHPKTLYTVPRCPHRRRNMCWPVYITIITTKG